ncbi:hypothetical protein FN846DRAFT_788476 [Sphaerosporella brunnea]|uniref:DMAP1-binding domain-containing protein n=1 Tax=Sphaerosporella brunnea TaxID=1250544 RepID=A0A5J5ECU3_9PEZI|nr:hypothetical protein FN846DRAFT_788476 [Sphaerosporella brunnea]
MENPELQAHLAALDAELEEGDITHKGYQKRRTLLLAQFGIPVGPSSTTSSNPSHQSLQQWRYSSGSIYQGADSPGGTGTMTSATVVSPPSESGVWGSFLQSTAPPHLRSNSNGSTRRDESLNVPMQGAHARNYSSASSNSQQQPYPYPPQQRHSQTPPQIEYDHYDEGPQMPTSESRSNTMYDAGNYFSDFTAQAYEPGRESMQLRRPESEYNQQQQMMHRYSVGEGPGFSPTAAIPPPMLNTGDLPSPGVTNTLMPLEPRDVPFAIDDPHNPNIPMSKFDNIAIVLRHRARSIPKQQAYIVLDNKGKEVAACSWEKLGARAEKVAQVIREKSGLYRGDRVALVYRDVELIDFAVALLGCFIAGVVAVPINNMEDYPKLNFILTSTQAHLALTTDSNLKAFQRELATQKLAWPRGVEWWKTNEFGSFHAKKNEDVPPLQVPDLAYIEFSRAPTGDLRGVVLSHRTIMHQMGTLSAIINTVPSDSRDTFDKSLRDKTGRPLAGGPAGEILVSYLDPRQGIGLIHSVLMAVYGGQTTVWCSQATTQAAGLYANIITRYKATLCLADYPALKLVAYNYQTDPFATRNFQKKYPVDFSSIKLMMIDALVVDSEFHEILADRWLKPLGNHRAREVVAPMLCLPEHGGMVISIRDWVGGEERMGCPLSQPEDEKEEPENGDESPIDPKQSILGNGYSSLLSGPVISENKEKKPPEVMEVLLDREALKTNDIVVVAMGAEVEKRGEDESALRVGAFGYPIPDATLAIVDPETSLLCSASQVGEIWVDSPSLSGGFWALPKQTETIFHARPYRFEEGNPHPVPVDPEFLRTGLLGCIIEGKIFVLGLYEDRLRQRVEWVDGEQMEPREEYRYFFVQHLVVTIMRKMSKIYDCSAFDVCVNDEHLPIILLESNAASTAPTMQGGVARQLDIALLDSISERCMEVLLTEHQLRVYCVMITAPGSLPRVIKFGRREIGNMLCRRDFDNGTLPCVHVEFGVERAVRNLPIGIDPVGGIWSYHTTQARHDLLGQQEKQYSGVDYRVVVIDDRTSTPLNNFSSIVDLLQWRVSRQAEELSYCSIDVRGREGKGVTWKKLDLKIAAVASQIKNKWKLKAGDHAILIYTHSEDFLYALHACFCLGVIAIPLAPLDSDRLAEDIPAFLHMITDFNVKMVLVNTEVEQLLKGKPLSIHLKQSAGVLGVKVPPVHNTAKPPKSSQGCRDLGYTVSPEWVQPGRVALVWTYWTPDQRRVSVALNHEAVMGMCKVMKETCQMTSSRPVVGCVRSTSGMGFVMSWLMGIFVGAPTYLISPIDFAQNPMAVFLTLSRYKIKDTYATRQMLEHAISTMAAKGFTLHELRNLMITCEGRPRPDVFQKVRMHFAGAGLDRTAINTVYSHVLNPMIATRSYMNIEPIELWLDPKALRRGLVIPVDPEVVQDALLVQDSGMVPVQTQVAIVNPETRRLCHSGEYGEIWVVSEACVNSFYNSRDAIDIERFQGRIEDFGDKTMFVRTGDLGFLHTVSRPIGPGQSLVEMQILFVLGGIGDTIEVNGLQHFPIDIESSVERCHRNIVPSGSACFQAGGLVVILVEVHVKNYLASMVPVIVNTILDQHQLVVDIVAFVGKGDFPRSRLGEKQRGKILASWVTRKMRTIAQFGIRDNHANGGAAAGNGGGSGSRPGSMLVLHPPSVLSETILETPTLTRGRTPTQSIHELPAENTATEGVELPAEEAGAGAGAAGRRGFMVRNPEEAPSVPEKSPRRLSARNEEEFLQEAVGGLRIGDRGVAM